MTTTRVIPEDTLFDQALASDPKNSVWVSANAGSGKTHVLAQRVIRLLLDGTEPSKILCLTYTKAAAANMSNRVFGQLGGWTALSDAELAREIARIEGSAPDALRLRRARQLFARALETPGGLKIQTIHAFCEAILHKFPLEANIAGHFEMLDGQMEAALVAEARRDMLSGIAAGGDAALAAAFETVLSIGGESGLDALLGEIVAKRDGLRGFIDALGSGDAPALFEEFGIAEDATPETIAADIWPDAYFTHGLGVAIQARATAAGKSIARDFGVELTALTEEADADQRFAKLCKLVLTKDSENGGLKPRSASRIMAKGVAEHFPGFADELQRLANALIEGADRMALLRMLEATRAALVIADLLIGRYERLKAARGFLDFNDLITRTVRLLARADVGPWVQYKLDRGIDHILVDEAQDTSPDQWDVVKRLAAEFFAGLGARDNVSRTIFAVGDEKQSIYSFQGADPESFATNGFAFQAQVRDASGRFERIRLQRSFRSTEDVLTAVDRVFAAAESRKGLTRDEEPIEHPTIRTSEPGYVEVWPLIEPAAVEEPDDWREAIDHASAPAVLLAEQVATTIRGWIDSGDVIEGKVEDGRARRLGPGDVLVLVRKRDRFVHALSRALKNRGVAVAGADRVSLPGHIAVKDLIALGCVALQPGDDLSLAALLRSPVFGVSEDMLFELAWNRGKTTLFAVLRGRAETDVGLAAIVERLDQWRNEAAFRPVFEFYAAVLARDGIRTKMIARLGPAAGEILDEFLSFCLAAERTGLPGLESFLATLESSGPDIKREMDQTRDEVRIMTVHAAKGLEAPVVFLVDSGSRPFSDAHLPRLLPYAARNGGWHGKGYLWRASGDLANAVSRAVTAGLAEKAEEEYRRLLYVGMTRAEDRLIVCGYRGKLPPKPGIWHNLVRGALSEGSASTLVRHPAAEVDVIRYRSSPVGPVPPAADRRATPDAAAAHETLPPLPHGAASALPLAPSGASALLLETPDAVTDGRSPVFALEAEPGFAIARGIVLHKLLQMLPGLPGSDCGPAATRYLDAAAADWPEAERRNAAGSVLAILDDPSFGPLFGENSRAEISIAGRLDIKGETRVISGKIDRLAVTETSIMIVDYKTNRPPPVSLEAVPEAYVAQLALYRALLLPLYPDRTVSAALLFTEVPRLIVIPASVMDASLVRLGKA